MTFGDISRKFRTDKQINKRTSTIALPPWQR